MKMSQMIAMILSLCVAFSTGRSLAQEPGVLSVDAGEHLGSISPYVYGSNYGPLSAITLDTMAFAEDSGITFLRFPGGAVGDARYLQSFEVDIFISLARKLNAEPSISVRLKNGTPEKAAELVHYVNIEKSYNVRYWGIGNEPSLYKDYTTEDHNREWRAIAEAMIAVDPDILLIGPDPNQYTGDPAIDPRDAEGRDWIREFLIANGDLVDIIAIHRYPFPKNMANPQVSIDELRMNAPEWSTILPSLQNTIRKVMGHDLPVAITEANSDWSGALHGEASPASFYHAIWWADVLGRLIQAQPLMINYFDLQSPNTRGGTGLIARDSVRPTYYVYQIYQRFGTELIKTTSSDNDVTIYGATRADGSLTLIVVNLSDQEQQRTLRLTNFDPGGVAEVWRFDEGHNAEQIADVLVQSDDILIIPAQSITLYIIPLSE